MTKYQSLWLTWGLQGSFTQRVAWGRWSGRGDRIKGDKWIHRLGPVTELLYNHRTIFRNPQVVEARCGISWLLPLWLLLLLTLKLVSLRDVCVDQGWVMLMEHCNIFPTEWQAAYESSTGTEVRWGGVCVVGNHLFQSHFPIDRSPQGLSHKACTARASLLVLSWEQ